MTTFEVRRVLDIKAEHAEGPLWSVEEQALFWVDIVEKTINKFDPASGEHRAWRLPAHPGCFAFREGGGAVISTDRGFYGFDFTSGEATLLEPAPFDGKRTRFNDGKTDRQGRLWAGTQWKGGVAPGEEAYFRYEKGVLAKGFANVTVANGTAFSPDGRTMYRAESMSHTILAADYDPETGTPSNERIFATVPQYFGVPDGAAVDSDGFYWCAAAFGESNGHVLRFTPDGALDLHFPMPVTVVTMVAFGGQDLSTLYITTGRIEHLLNRPHSEWGGDLFAVETPFRGIPETPYRG